MIDAQIRFEEDFQKFRAKAGMQWFQEVLRKIHGCEIFYVDTRGRD